VRSLPTIEARTITLNRARGEDAAFGHKERAPFRLRMFRLDEGRDELSGQIQLFIITFAWVESASQCCPTGWRMTT